MFCIGRSIEYWETFTGQLTFAANSARKLRKLPSFKNFPIESNKNTHFSTYFNVSTMYSGRPSLFERHKYRVLRFPKMFVSRHKSASESWSWVRWTGTKFFGHLPKWATLIWFRHTFSYWLNVNLLVIVLDNL